MRFGLVHRAFLWFALCDGAAGLIGPARLARSSRAVGPPLDRRAILAEAADEPIDWAELGRTENQQKIPAAEFYAEYGAATRALFLSCPPDRWKRRMCRPTSRCGRPVKM